VYDWRQEQEAALRASKGTGMTDEQVIKFVNGCESNDIALRLPVYDNRVVAKANEKRTTDYPCYELYSSALRNGVFEGSRKGQQLHFVVGKDRRLRDVRRV
jgi:D-glycerate 3-kinase